MPSTEREGLSYPTHFLKSRGCVVRNTFLVYRTKQATLFARRNNCMHCSLRIKQTINSIGIFRAPVVTLFIVSPLCDFIRYIFCDDALHKLRSLHAS